MKKFFKNLLITGLITLLAGFAYGVLSVGVPYPEPTPAQARAQTAALLKSDTITIIGTFQLAMGILGWAAVRIFSGRKPNGPAN